MCIDEFVILDTGILDTGILDTEILDFGYGFWILDTVFWIRFWIRFWIFWIFFWIFWIRFWIRPNFGFATRVAANIQNFKILDTFWIRYEGSCVFARRRIQKILDTYSREWKQKSEMPSSRDRNVF